MSCPFAGAAGVRPPPMQQPPAGAGCPMAAALAAQHDGTAPPVATCPLGFGTARGPKLTKLHCPVCRALLFNAQRVRGCSHTFCEPCIRATRDCPVCGADVDALEANTELAGLVDTFLDTHSKSPELVAAQADLGPLPDNTAASFFMAQGLKSLAGGNVHAALHRLGRSRQELVQAAPGASPAAAAAAAGDAAGDGSGAASTSVAGSSSSSVASSNASTGAATQQQPPPRGGRHSSGGGAVGDPPDARQAHAIQLATVCGCLGDCYQQLGRAAQAEQLYSDSVAVLQPHAEHRAEAAHALSVSLNKLGDLRYTQQQLPAAKALYRQALQLRELCCGPLTRGAATPEQQLDLAASLIKLADVSQGLGQGEEAGQCLRRAHGVCCEVQALSAAGAAPGAAGAAAPGAAGEAASAASDAAGGALSAAAVRKLRALLAALQAQGHGVDAGGTTAAAAAD